MKVAIIVLIILLILFIWIRNKRPNSANITSDQNNIEKIDYSKPMEITSRLSDELEKQGVKLDPNVVPENLRILWPLAIKWAIGDDVERDYFIHNISKEEKKEFIETVWPKMDEIEKWCSAQRGKIPAVYEHVLFDNMAEAAAELYYDME